MSSPPEIPRFLPGLSLALRFRLTAATRAFAIALAGLVALVTLFVMNGGAHLPAILATVALQGTGWLLGGLYAPLWTGLFAPLPAEGEALPQPARGASWAGALTGASLASILAALALPALGGLSAASPLLAFALAANVAYLPAKLACLVWGCCRSAGGALGRFPGDLPGLEIALTLAILAASAGAAAASPALAVATACLGHALVRALAAHLRGLGRAAGWPLADPGFEMAALAGVPAAALLLG